MEIRRVTGEDDFGAISRIYALSWKAAYKNIVPGRYLDELSETRWAGILSEGRWDSFVIVVDGEYAGTTSVCPARDETMDGWGEIVSIYLLPEHIGKGYGKLLLNAAVSELKAKGYDRIYLWVLEENAAARAFYERNGFVPTPDRTDIEIGGKRLTEMRYVYSD